MATQIKENWRDEFSTGKAQFFYVFRNGLFCDIKFLIGPDQDAVYCHSFVLKVRSPVFEKIVDKLPIAVKENVKEMVIERVSISSFKKFLQFLYADQLDADSDEALDILYLAKKYGIHELTRKCAAQIKTAITDSNAISIFQLARDCKEIELEQKALRYIYCNIASIVEQDDFLKTTHSNLCYLLSQDEPEISELALFNAAIRWAKSECSKHRLHDSPKHLRLVLKEALHEIRFPLMTSEEYHSKIVGLSLLNEKESSEISKYLAAEPASREFVRPSLFKSKLRHFIREDEILDLNKFDDENHKRLAKYAIKKSSIEFSGPTIVSSLILDVEPLDKSIDLDKLDKDIRAIKKFGLHWGGSTVVGSKESVQKLKISFIAEEKRSYGVGTVVEAIQDLSDGVRQVYVVSFREEVEV